MKIQNNQYTSNSNVNFGVNVVLHRNFYTNPDKAPKTVKKIIDVVEEQTKDIPGTLNLRDYFRSCHDTDPYNRHTVAYYENGEYKDMVVLYDSEKLNLWKCNDEKLINTLVNLAKVFQTRENTLTEKILPLRSMIQTLEDDIKSRMVQLNLELYKHYKNMGLPQNYSSAQFGGELNDRSYLYLGDVNLKKVSQACKNDKVEQDHYLQHK